MRTSQIGLAGIALLTASLALAQAPATGTSTEAASSTAAAPAAPDKKLSYTDDYRISVNHDADSDGESVIIERSGGKSDTSLVLVSSTVKGVTVKVHRD